MRGNTCFSAGVVNPNVSICRLASSLIRSKFNMLVSEQKLLAEPRKGLVSLLPSGLQQDVAAALKPIPISKRLSWLEALVWPRHMYSYPCTCNCTAIDRIYFVSLLPYKDLHSMQHVHTM